MVHGAHSQNPDAEDDFSFHSCKMPAGASGLFPNVCSYTWWLQCHTKSYFLVPPSSSLGFPWLAFSPSICSVYIHIRHTWSVLAFTIATGHVRPSQLPGLPL